MIPRSEHPHPQWQRENYRILNGEWEFDFDFGRTAREREVWKDGALPKRITVPFCPESDLSGIGYKDFMAAVCYRRVVSLGEKECEGRVILHFGAVDYKSYIYVNGELAGKHIGGYSSFSIDVTKHISVGDNEIFVIAEDDLRSKRQPSGKQSDRADSYSCMYTRTTGIWQTVWLEFVPNAYIKSVKYYPDVENAVLTVIGQVIGTGSVKLSANYEGRRMGETAVSVGGDGGFTARIALAETHLWEAGCGRLYDLTLTFGDDTVSSYFGLRSTAFKDKKFLLNGKTLFQRFVLDQGFYPDGIYTAPSDEILRRDIELGLLAGYNGARLHQKVFEPRFLYHCDKMGYLVYGEHANWGMDHKDPVTVSNFLCEWTEAVERDFNHPAIIGWCPFNETFDYRELESDYRMIEAAYRMTKAIDVTRPCIAVSGHFHIDGMEIHDVHDYCNSIEEFRESYAHIAEGIVNDQIRRAYGDVQPYRGQGVFVSEYGGFLWREDATDESGWGYGNAPQSKEELITRYRDYTNVLLDNPDMMGFCYTQLYDVELEQNGLYTYDRKPKFDMSVIRAINTRKAKIEEE